MVDRNPNCFHLSASAIAAFKACPERFRLMYREGIREGGDTDNQRMGTNWHALHEVYQNAIQANLYKHEKESDRDGAAFEAAIEHLNERYATVPDTKTVEEWEVERQTLVMSFVGYLWYWQDDPVETISTEVPFELPVHSPKTGRPLPLSSAKRVGKIDTVIRWRDRICNHEIKSTSKAVDDSSDFWERSQKDTQVSMYALAWMDMREHGLHHYGIEGVGDDEPSGNTLYDAWKKPTIKPTKLSQKDTAEFLESGEYCGVEFKVETPGDLDDGGSILVDDRHAEFEIGKSGKPAIRETPEMFGARLLNDIYERPEFYFNRREIARTKQDLAKFRIELFNILQAMKMYDKYGVWFENEQQCRAAFPCPMIPICYGAGADAICNDEADVPQGLRRIFDVTVEGEPQT